jgi:hypothetical protein
MISAAVFAAASFVMLPVLTAQDYVMRVDVPFAFAVGDTSLPAGSYNVQRDASRNLIVLNCRDANAAVAKIGHGVYNKRIPEQGKLVFHRYGDKYFLNQITVPGSRTATELNPTKTEREYVAQAASSVSLVARR